MKFRNSNQIEKFNEERFGVKLPWGEGIQLHCIGDLRILAYYPRKSEGVRITEEIDYDKIEYHGVGMSQSFNSLDEAIVGCISYKYGGCSSHVNTMVRKMLDGMKEPHSNWAHVIHNEGYKNAKIIDGHERNAKVNELLLELRPLRLLRADIMEQGSRLLCDYRIVASKIVEDDEHTNLINRMIHLAKRSLGL